MVNVRSPQRHALRQGLQLLLTSLHLSFRDLHDTTKNNNNNNNTSTNYDRITLSQQTLSSEEFGLQLLSLFILLLPSRDNDKKQSAPQRSQQQQQKEKEKEEIIMQYHDEFDVTLTSIVLQLLMHMPPTTLTLTCVKMKT